MKLKENLVVFCYFHERYTYLYGKISYFVHQVKVFSVCREQIIPDTPVKNSSFWWKGSWLESLCVTKDNKDIKSFQKQ